MSGRTSTRRGSKERKMECSTAPTTFSGESCRKNARIRKYPDKKGESGCTGINGGAIAIVWTPSRPSAPAST